MPIYANLCQFWKAARWNEFAILCKWVEGFWISAQLFDATIAFYADFMQILCKFYDVIHSNLIYDFRLIANCNRRVTDGGQLPIVCKFYANFMQILWKKEVKEEIQFDWIQFEMIWI